jgi:hypothetical protein
LIDNIRLTFALTSNAETDNEAKYEQIFFMVIAHTSGYESCSLHFYASSNTSSGKLFAR